MRQTLQFNSLLYLSNGKDEELQNEIRGIRENYTFSDFFRMTNAVHSKMRFKAHFHLEKS